MTPDGEMAWIIGASRKADETFEREGITLTSARETPGRRRPSMRG